MTDTVNVPREVVERAAVMAKAIMKAEPLYGCVGYHGDEQISGHVEEAANLACLVLDDLVEPVPAPNALAAAPKAEPVEFGNGMLVVDTGRYGGKPAVFIAPAKIGGKVGESSEIEDHAKDALQDGETVWAFPTEEQARMVADALVNAQPEAPKVEQEPVICHHEAYQGYCAHCGVKIVNGFAVMPRAHPAPSSELRLDEIDLFRIIREAGRTDREKAKAIYQAIAKHKGPQS